MKLVEEVADFVNNISFQDFSKEARDQIKIRVLDSLGCAFGALPGEPIAYIRKHIQDFGGADLCTVIGGGRSAPDRAAFYNSALVRYLDFNDSYLAKGETCHPSDNLGAVMAACEYANASGRDFMTSLGVAYQVQCRLSDEAPVRSKGFDHVTQGAYAVAAGVSKALGLDREKTANAIAISGTAFNALRVTRTGNLSHWKGLAYPNTGFGGLHAAFLAMRGITGPLEVFEGNKGFMEAIAGEFHIDWSRENLDRVTRTIIKKYNAEIHSQPTIEGIIELKQLHDFDPKDIERIEIDIFDVAFHIIGGGEEGSKYEIKSKEEADHSLPYMVAVALLDGLVGPDQYTLERIRSDDVQKLLQRVKIRPSSDYSHRFPDQMPCHIKITLKNGDVLEINKVDYEGFLTRPMSWENVEIKFKSLSNPFTSVDLQREIVEAVGNLENISTREMTRLLAKVQFDQDK
jgi:2-methylcitrate dehydratase